MSKIMQDKLLKKAIEHITRLQDPLYKGKLESHIWTLLQDDEFLQSWPMLHLFLTQQGDYEQFNLGSRLQESEILGLLDWLEEVEDVSGYYCQGRGDNEYTKTEKSRIDELQKLQEMIEA